ncbi:MAG: flagellar basal body-associated FliL family protein [Pseudomonadota bacterium]
MTDTLSPDTPPPRKGGLLGKIIAFLLGGILFGAGGYAAATFFPLNADPPASDVLRLIESDGAGMDGGPKKVPKVLPDASVFETRYYQFPEPLTTNLRASRRFLQISVGVSTQYDETVIENVETHGLALQSDILAVMSTFGEEEVTGQAGRDALSNALKDAMNSRLEDLEGFGGIEGVFFPSFVMQ